MLNNLKMRFILIITKKGFEGFSSLKPFFEAHPEFEVYKSQIRYILSRKKGNVFECDDFVLIRFVLNEKPVYFDILKLLNILRAKNEV